jgi:hypothetical protein
MATDSVALSVAGKSSFDGLDLPTLTAIVEQALDVVQPGERVLAIIPDKTRDDNTHQLFPSGHMSF